MYPVRESQLYVVCWNFEIYLGGFLEYGKCVLETFELEIDISVVSVGLLVWAFFSWSH